MTSRIPASSSTTKISSPWPLRGVGGDGASGHSTNHGIVDGCRAAGQHLVRQDPASDEGCPEAAEEPQAVSTTERPSPARMTTTACTKARTHPVLLCQIALRDFCSRNPTKPMYRPNASAPTTVTKGAVANASDALSAVARRAAALAGVNSLREPTRSA